MGEKDIKSYDISTFQEFKFLSDIGFIFCVQKKILLHPYSCNFFCLEPCNIIQQKL